MRTTRNPTFDPTCNPTWGPAAARRGAAAAAASNPIEDAFAASPHGFWLKSGTGLLQTEGGSAAADTDPVGEWEDQSGNGIDLLQSTAANRGTHNISGGLSYVSFDGSSDVLEAAITRSTWCDASKTGQLAIAVRPQATLDRLRTYWSEVDNDGAADEENFLRQSSDRGSYPHTQYEASGDRDSTNAAAPVLIDNEWCVLSVEHDGTSAILRWNGVKVSDQPLNLTTLLQDRMGLGAEVNRSDAVSQRANADIAEIFASNGALPSGVTLQDIEDHLADLVGVTISRTGLTNLHYNVGIHDALYTENTPSTASANSWYGVAAPKFCRQDRSLNNNGDPSDTNGDVVERWGFLGRKARDTSAANFSHADGTTAPTMLVDGDYYAVRFDGSDDVLRNGTSMVSGDTNNRHGIWCFLVSGAASANKVFYSEGNDAVGNDDFIAFGTANDGTGAKLRIEVEDGGVSNTDITSTGTVFDGTKHLVTITVDRDTDDVQIFIDGTLDSTHTDAWTTQNELNLDEAAFGGLVQADVVSRHMAVDVYAAFVMSDNTTQPDRAAIEAEMAKFGGLSI